MNTKIIVICAVVLVNCITYLLYARDKRAARRHRRRTSERALLWAAFFGPFGAVLAMQLLRHKTKHRRFVILVPLFALLQLGGLYYLWISWN